MSSVNELTLVGHVGSDADTRFTSGNRAIVSFSVATTRKWKSEAGEAQEKTEWHRCTMWGERAEKVGKYITKGKLVYVRGRIESRQYDDKDGIKRTVWEVNVQDVELFGGGSDDRKQDESGERQAVPPQSREAVQRPAPARQAVSQAAPQTAPAEVAAPAKRKVPFSF